MEFERKTFLGLTSLQILQENKDNVQKRNIEPEKFTDRIIFMSMCNDIDWTRKGNDEICISNSEKVKMYAKRFSQGHWTFLGLEDEKKWYGNRNYKPEGKWTSVASKMVQRFKETGHPVFTSASALSRGIQSMLKEKRPYTSMRMLQTQNSCSESFIHSVKTTQYLRSSLERKKISQKENPGTKKDQRKWTHKKWTLWCHLRGLDSYLETGCGKTFKTSSHCPRLFSS